jgi:hypothetical protein
VAQDDIFSVIRRRDILIDVHHHAGSGGQYGINRLAPAIPLAAPDIDALVQPPAAVAHTAKRPARPRTPGARWREEICFAASLEQSMIGGGK